jgi:urease accessory protein
MSVLEVFRSLPIVRDVHHDELPPAARHYRRDTITLGWEERLKARGRRTTDAGAEFATALPRGTILRGGDRLVLEAAATVVEVIERSEAVLVIEPASPEEWGLFAYHIGNSHQPMMICDRRIVCPDVPGMQQVLEYYDILFSRALRPFTPLAAVPDHRHRV